MSQAHLRGSFGAFAFLVLCLAASAALGADSDPASHWLLLDATRARGRLFAVGERGAVLASQDSGHSWQRISSPLSSTLTGIVFDPSGREGWICGHEGSLLHSMDAGQSWAAVKDQAAQDASLLDIQFIGEKRLLAAGAFGVLLRSEDAGASWSQIAHPGEDLHINQILPLPSGGILLCGEGGLLLLSHDTGLTWTRLEAPYEGSFFGALPLKGSKILIHGLRGHAFTVDFAQPIPEWTESKVPRPALLATALQLNNGTLILAGQARNFLVSRDAGLSFEDWASGVTSAVSLLLPAPDGSLLAFGEAGVSRLSAPKAP